jgi:hypothetical protein
MGEIVTLNDLKARTSDIAQLPAKHHMTKDFTFIFLNNHTTIILKHLGPFNLFTTAEVLDKAKFEVIEDAAIGEMAELLYG